MAANKSEESLGELLAAISNTVVKVHADHIGRGPTRARTYMNGSVVTCLLEDTLTRAERTLLNSGEEQRVLDMRRSLRTAMREELIAEVESLTGRVVRATISGTQVEPDVSGYVFVLDGRAAQ